MAQTFQSLSYDVCSNLLLKFVAINNLYLFCGNPPSSTSALLLNCDDIKILVY